MLVKPGGVIGLGLAVMALAGCAPASYSVAQVESAFAAHGTSLHRVQLQQEARGVVELANSSGGVVVLVGWGSGRSAPVFVARYDPLLVRTKPIAQGDLLVYATPKHTDAVQAALRQLRR